MLFCCIASFEMNTIHLSLITASMLVLSFKATMILMAVQMIQLDFTGKISA